MRFLSKHILLIIVASLYFCACATTGPGGKKSLIIIPTSQEVALGSAMAEEVARTEKTLADSVWQNYLNEVGQRIVLVSDRKDIKYYFTVIESDQINAFAAPGGYVYFYTGLLREMNSEAEMAAVMAHEISHVVARHGIKRVQQALGVQLAYALVFGGDDAGAAVNAGIGLGMGLLFADYSRGAEREADQYGIHYMIKAGYDPAGAIDMFETLGRLGGERSGNVFEKLVSSHPETQERIANTKSQIRKRQPLTKHLSLGKEKYQLMLKRLPPKRDGN